jgi:hypothetical protein
VCVCLGATRVPPRKTRSKNTISSPTVKKKSLHYGLYMCIYRYRLYVYTERARESEREERERKREKQRGERDRKTERERETERERQRDRETERDRQTETETDRDRQRETDRQTDRQTEREREREREDPRSALQPQNFPKLPKTSQKSARFLRALIFSVFFFCQSAWWRERAFSRAAILKSPLYSNCI